MASSSRSLSWISPLGLMKSVIITVMLLATTTIRVGGNVMSVDLGSDSMKIAIVQPGMPMEIVTNLQSKRKTPTCLAFYKGERLFGSDGYALMGRKPELSLAKFNRLIGRSADHPRVEELKAQYFPYEIYMNDTMKSTAIKVEDTYYTPEELLAMLLQHAKLLAFNHGGKAIKDCVITVPSSFTQHEKSAVFTAASIADLNILTLIEENTAAALQYGIDRIHETPTNVLYYNMGAEGIQVTVVTYSSYAGKENGKNKTIGHFDVIGKAWDDSVGGFNFDVKIAELLADRFNAIWFKKAGDKAGDLKQFSRPMTRLRLEANKAKEVLSANQVFHFKAEQLHANIDLVTEITRSDFEAASEDLFAKLMKPVDAALSMANITLGDIQAVELLGGSVRIPKVKKLLDDYFKGSAEVGQHLNGDEAMALGAAFRAANLSTAFRVRKVGMSDFLTFGVSVKLDTLPKSKSSSGSIFGLFSKDDKKSASEGEVWSKKTVLYPSQSQLPGKTKTLAFEYDQDILCKVHFSDDLDIEEGERKLLAVYNITGISDFAKEVAAKGLGVPKVHISFSLDSSGIVTLNKAEATVELMPDTKSEGNSNTNDTDVNKDKSDTTSEESESESSASSESNETASSDSKKEEAKPKDGEKKKAEKKKKEKKEDKKKEEKKETTLRRVLSVAENESDIIPAKWSMTAIANAKARLRQLDLIDEQRKAREAALNDLEAFIYSARGKINDDEGGKISSVSTEEQREEVVNLANTIEEWLYEEGRNADLNQFKAKQAEISSKANPIFFRVSELTDRPAAVAKARKAYNDIMKIVEGWSEKMPQITSEEKEKLTQLLQKAMDWVDEKQAAQSKLKGHETPAFESSDIMPQFKAAGVLFEKLSKKPKPPPEKVVNANATDANATNPSNSSTEETPDPVEVKIPSDGPDEEKSEDTKDKTSSEEEL